jgi:hypothetical protein
LVEQVEINEEGQTKVSAGGGWVSWVRISDKTQLFELATDPYDADVDDITGEVQ